MNLSIGTTTFGTWKRIKTQQLVALCGAALAISAAVGVGAWQATDSGSRAVPAAGVVQPAAPATFVYYYVVDSPERGAAIASNEAQTAMSLGVNGVQVDHEFQIIDVSQPGGEAALAELTRSVMALPDSQASRMQIINLRGR